MNISTLSRLTGLSVQDVNKFLSVLADLSLSPVSVCTKESIDIDITPYGILHVDVYDVNNVSITIDDNYKQKLLKCVTEGYDPLLIRLEHKAVSCLKSKYIDVLGE